MQRYTSGRFKTQSLNVLIQTVSLGKLIRMIYSGTTTTTIPILHTHIYTRTSSAHAFCFVEVVCVMVVMECSVTICMPP